MSAINIAAAMISETAREENGPTKGSESAKMQSQLTKAQNAKKGNAIASTELDSKNAPHPSKNTQSLEDSRESHKQDVDHFRTGSAAAEAKSKEDRHVNFSKAADMIGTKMQNDPISINKEDAAYIQSREHRALGYRPPHDSVSAEAERMAAANEKHKEAIAGAMKKQSHAASTLPISKAGHDIDAEKDSMILKLKLEGLKKDIHAGRTLPISKSGQDITALEKDIETLRLQLEHLILPEKQWDEIEKKIKDLEERKKRLLTNEGEFQRAIDLIKPKMDLHPETVTKEDAALLHSHEEKAHGKTEKGGITAQAQSLADHNTTAESLTRA